jgi:archaellum component FlaC
MSTDFVLLNENIGSTIASFDSLNSKIEQATNINIDSGSINNQLSALTNNLDGLNENIGTAKTQLETFNDQINKLKTILSDL